MKKTLLIIIAIFSIVLTGCASNTEAEKKNNSIPASNSEVFEREGEMVSFQTELVVDNAGEEDQMYSGTAKLQPVHYEELKQLLFGSEELEENSDSLNNYFGDKYTAHDYVSKEKNALYLGDQNASYSTPFSFYIDAAFDMEEYSESYNADKYSTSKDFDGFTRKEAFKELKTVLEKIGYNLPDEYFCYTLDHETMEKEEHWEDMDGNDNSASRKESWTEEDDSYYFIINQRYHGLPVYHPLYYQETEDKLSNAPVQAVISRRGIEMLLLERLFTFENDEPVESIKTFPEIADSIENKLSQIIGSEPFVVTKAELKYYEQLTGKDEYQVIPIWMISYQQESQGTVWHYQTIYDAVSGEEIRP